MLKTARVVLFAAVPAELLVLVLLVVGVRLPSTVVAAVEVAVLAVLAVEVAVLAGLYRTQRAGGATRTAALRAAYERLIPVQVRRVMGFDAKGLVSIVLWLGRRRHGVPPGAVAVPYFGAQAPALLVFLGAMVAELVVVEIVLRGVGAPLAVRAVLLTLDGYSILLALAVIAGCVTRPHVAGAGEVRVRSGAFFDLRIPAERVATVRRVRGFDERGTVRVEDGVLTVAVSSQVNVELVLTGPVTAVRPLGRRCEVHTVRLFADEPDAAVRAVEAAASRPRYARPDVDGDPDADVQRPVRR